MLTIWSVVCTADGTPDLRDRRHLLDAREHLDADHGRLQPKQAVEIGHHAGQIERFRRRLLLHGVNSQIGALNCARCPIVARLASGCDLYFGAGPGNNSSILPVSPVCDEAHPFAHREVGPSQPSTATFENANRSSRPPTRQSTG